MGWVGIKKCGIERERGGEEKRERKRDKRWREGEEIENETEGRHKKGDVSYHSLTRGGDWNFFCKNIKFQKTKQILKISL